MLLHQLIYLFLYILINKKSYNIFYLLKLFENLKLVCGMGKDVIKFFIDIHIHYKMISILELINFSITFTFAICVFRDI